MCCFAPFNKTLFCLFAAIALVLASCEKEAAKTEDGEDFLALTDNEYIEPATEQFKEPSELKISYKKARNFNKASEALIFMGQQWVKEMEEANEEEKLRIAAAYEKAQDDLIRKFGICGKEEFKWIQTKVLLEPSNRDIFAKAGVWIKR